MAELAAWSQLRAAGWRGSDRRENLMAFGADASWRKELQELAVERSETLRGYWKEYCSAYDDGVFD